MDEFRELALLVEEAHADLSTEPVLEYIGRRMREAACRMSPGCVCDVCELRWGPDEWARDFRRRGKTP